MTDYITEDMLTEKIVENLIKSGLTYTDEVARSAMTQVVKKTIEERRKQVTKVLEKAEESLRSSK